LKKIDCDYISEIVVPGITKYPVFFMPHTLQKSVSDGMSALINIENRIRNQSGNINHPGIGINASHDIYMAYLRGETALGPTAWSMVQAIKMVIDTKTLTEVEIRQLTHLAAEIVGDAELVQAYVDEDNILVSMDEIDSERGVGDNEIAKYINKMPKTPKEYYASALEVGKRSDLTVEQKVRLLQAMYYALGDGNRKDVRCPADSRFVKGFDEDGYPVYDWPKYWGFVLSSIKPLRRGKLNLPRLWSRVGSMHGNSFSDISANGVSYTNSQRSLPDIENPEAEHRGTSRQDDYYFDVIDAIAARDLDGLNKLLNQNGIRSISNKDMKNIVRAYESFIVEAQEKIGSGINVKYGLFGYAAPWIKDGKVLLKGGATQYTLPLSIIQLIELGVLKK